MVTTLDRNALLDQTLDQTHIKMSKYFNQNFWGILKILSIILAQSQEFNLSLRAMIEDFSKESRVIFKLYRVDS